MRLPYLGVAAVCDVLLPLLLLSATRPVAAADDTASTPEPLWIQSSGEWYGIDGTWSNFAFVVGSPGQLVYLTVATTLSETWVISTGGCVPVQLCINARGGVFDGKASETWRSLGSWQLGMNHTGVEANGDYGLDTFAFVNTVTRYTTVIDGVLVAAINDTNYYQGFIGVGVTQGKFGSNLTNPFISQLAETYGKIPSHGYGYTAGAYYRSNGKSTGTVASLTLGGYDTLRFVPHDKTFSLDPLTRLPNVRLRGVIAEVISLDKAPVGNWSSPTQTLVNMEDGITAVIDSSTPYLWLPTEVCERFARALNLTWREDLGVYVFSSGDQYTRYQTDTDLSFTFSLSSYDNTDNFGQPLNVPGVVNITLPSAAFAQLLRYPFKNLIQWGDSSIPYFPLKRSTKYIIGRVFMQEAYIITSYDKGRFSLHQALFPNSASANYSLQAIERPPDSPYPGFEGNAPEIPNSPGLKAGQTAGIVVSAFLTGCIIGLIFWCCCRRRRKARQQQKQAGELPHVEENKDAVTVQFVEGNGEPQSPVKRMFTKIVRRKKLRKPVTSDESGSSVQAAEVGADEDHQVFELPVPPEPVELDSHDLGDDDDATHLGMEDTQGLSQYEITRRKLEKQMQGPVPTYSATVYSGTTAMTPTTAVSQDKLMQDISSIPHYRPSDEPSPVSSPTCANSNSLPNSLPSPLSPHPDWTNRMFDLPSPMTVAPTHMHFPVPGSSEPVGSYSPTSPQSAPSPHTYAPSSLTRSTRSDSNSPTSAVGSMRLPSPTYQRTPIDQGRVVCLGPLPENIQLPHQRALRPRGTNTEGRGTAPGEGPPQSVDLPLPGPLGQYRSLNRGSSETLGSNFTVDEENRLHNGERQEDGGAAAESMPPPALVTTRAQSSRQRQAPHVHLQRRPSQRPVQDDAPRSPQSMERIEAGSELIHVPQVADKRYSWEPDGN